MEKGSSPFDPGQIPSGRGCLSRGITREKHMSAHTPNELADIFAGDAAALHQLKLTNAHFARLAERHHVVNREIHRIEAEVEAASDERLEALKKERLNLLDEIAAMLEQTPAE